MRVIGILALLLTMAVAACTSSDSTTADTGVPEGPERCVDAPQEVMEFLATGFVDASFEFRFGKAVKSQVTTGAWIISGEVDNDRDFSGDGDIGIWATIAPNWPSMVDAAATEDISRLTTDWGAGLDVVFNRATDGVISAESCALQASGLVP